MTVALKSYVEGKWVDAGADTTALTNPTTEELVATASSADVDFAAALAYARSEGGPALRAMTFAQRGQMLLEMSKAIHAHREELLDLATQNAGNTRSDGKFDIDGATGTMAFYGKLGSHLGERKVLDDDEAVLLTRSPRWVGRHIYTPRHGVAILINAYNFPAWGFGEKAAAALLAGMPVLNKPATSTALVAARIAEILVAAEVMPKGVFSSVVGSAGDMLDHAQWQDVVAFTGSSATGLRIRSNGNIMQRNVRVNVEADSLNSAVLGADLDRDADAYDLFLREVARDITQKAGQKCTATRRIFVPRAMMDVVSADLREHLAAVRIGDPALGEVKMGPLATAQQLSDVKAELAALMQQAKPVYGDGGRGTLHGIENNKGYFVGPTLLRVEDADAAERVHNREVFGPVATLLPYDGTAQEACRLLAKGEGSLVSSVYSDDHDFMRAMVEGSAAFLGRMHLASSKIAEHSVGPGTVLPMLSHGGPGRAGGGAELGGTHGLRLYMQRTAVQGFAPLISDL